MRVGTRKDGSEWKRLPFVFEYFESADQRFSDKVLLEAREPSHFGMIGRFVERGADGKGVVDNGFMKLTGEIKCKCGFGHSVSGYNGKLYNQVSLYKFELLEAVANAQPQQPAANAPGTGAQPQQGTGAPYQQPAANAAGEDYDGLPF